MLLKKVSTFIHCYLHGDVERRLALVRALWLVNATLEWGFVRHSKDKPDSWKFNPLPPNNEALWKYYDYGHGEGELHERVFGEARRMEINLTPGVSNTVSIDISYFRKGDKEAPFRLGTHVDFQGQFCGARSIRRGDCV